MHIRTYRITVLTPQGCCSYNALATGGCDAINNALAAHEDARRISAKPVAN